MKKLFKIFLPFLISGLFFFPVGLVLGSQGYFPKIAEKLVEYSILAEDKKAPAEVKGTFSKVNLDRFWQVWNLLQEKYLQQPLDEQKMLNGAISGMVSSLGDPYTAFLPPSQNKEVKDLLNGRYEGIGAELGMRNNQLIIVAPLDGSPAQKAGVQAGDKIIKINSEETRDINIMEAVSKIRGEAGTVVILNLDREGKGQFDASITRDKIVLKSVTWKDQGEGVVYIKVSNFGEQANKEWDAIVMEIIKTVPQISGVILDLRSNPGGYFNSAIHIGSEFISQGLIVKEEFGDKTQKHFSVIRHGELISVPVVVLIDKGSASASEILAGALRDRRGAKLVGTDSFGKGIVQDSHEFEDGAALHVTIAKWLTPAGIWVDEKGLSVDYQVEFTDEERERNEDPQLEKAVEILRAQL